MGLFEYMDQHPVATMFFFILTCLTIIEVADIISNRSRG